MRQCNAAMSQNKNLLNDPHENQKMLMRLPDWLVLRYDRIVSTYRLQGQFPKFQEFVNFIEVEAEIACNPVSSLQFSKKTLKMEAVLSRSDVKRISFSTKVSKCIQCEQDYHISICAKFLKKTLGDRKASIKKSELCYGCRIKGTGLSSANRGLNVKIVVKGTLPIFMG